MPPRHIPCPAAGSHPNAGVRRPGGVVAAPSPDLGGQPMRPALWKAATLTIWIAVGIAYVAVVTR